MKKFDLTVSQNYESDIRKKISGYDKLHFFIKLLMRSNLSEKNDVLIIGVGTGEELKYILPMEKINFIRAIDISPEMLALAKYKVDDAFTNKIILEATSFEKFQDEKTYNIVLSILVSHFVDYNEKIKFFQKISEKLKSDGFAVIVDSFIEDQREKDFLFKLWLETCRENYSETECQQIEHDFAKKFFPLDTQKFTKILDEVNLKVESLFFKSSIFRGYVVKRTADLIK